VKTDHILFIASGAFHLSKPSDLIPELQGRLPIRVELDALTVADFERILTATDACLTRQYEALLATEGVTLHSIRARAEEEARLLGVQLGDSEIVGLLPESALRAGGDPNALKIRSGWQRASIESRLAR
jgi:hypothetical protein